MKPFPDLSLVEARDALASGVFSALEYVDALIERIDDINPQTHIFLTQNFQHARQQAKRCDALWSSDKVRPLHGIPFAVKDLIDVQGFPTTCGSRSVPLSQASSTASCVQSLIDAGGIFLGKTNLYEFGIGALSFDSYAPPVRNPLNKKYTPGSSSSGSGAALAAGMVPLALGTDTAGSVRSPAMMNGVVGLKPTSGIGALSGVYPMAPSMDTVGLMTRSAADLACVLDALQDSVPPVVASPYRIGALNHLWQTDCKPSPDVTKAMTGALNELSKKGMVIEESTIHHIGKYNAVGSTIMHREMFETHAKNIFNCPELFGSGSRNMILTGALISDETYQSAKRLRDPLRRAIDDALENFDCLVTAVSALPPCLLEDTEAMADLAAASIRVVFSVTGHPVLAIPIGFSSAGLPISFQIIGHHGGDRELVEIGTAIESVLNPFRQTISVSGFNRNATYHQG